MSREVFVSIAAVVLHAVSSGDSLGPAPAFAALNQPKNPSYIQNLRDCGPADFYRAHIHAIDAANHSGGPTRVDDYLLGCLPTDNRYSYPHLANVHNPYLRGVQPTAETQPPLTTSLSEQVTVLYPDGTPEGDQTGINGDDSENGVNPLVLVAGGSAAAGAGYFILRGRGRRYRHRRR